MGSAILPLANAPPKQYFRGAWTSVLIIEVSTFCNIFFAVHQQELQNYSIEMYTSIKGHTTKPLYYSNNETIVMIQNNSIVHFTE